MSGRIRTIKPELLEDEKTASLSDSEFRVFIGLLLLADDYGNFRANPTWVRSQIYWARDDVGQIRETLATLSRLSPGTLAPDLRSPTSDHRPGAGRECEGNQPGEAPTKPDASTEPDPLPVAVATGPTLERSNSIEAPEAKPKRKGRLPDSWVYTAQHRDKAYELGLDVDAEANAFRDYHAAHGSTMANWDMAFHTWLRNAVKFGPAPSKAPEPAYLEIPDDAGPAMSLAEALQFCPPEHRGPIQEFLGGIR